MKQYEYKVGYQGDLEKLGKEGWKVVASDADSTGYFKVIFMREVEEEPIIDPEILGSVSSPYNWVGETIKGIPPENK